jgi:hypothetical protein
VLLDAVEPVAVIAGLQAPGDCGLENLTGLVRPVSGRRRPPELRPSPATTPLHRRIDQVDQRLNLALAQRLEGGADDVSAHGVQATPGPGSGQASDWLAAAAVTPFGLTSLGRAV